MLQIEYEDEVSEGCWHPIYADDTCPDVREAQPRKDRWIIQRTPQDRAFDAALKSYLSMLLVDDGEAEFRELAKRWKRETALDGHLSKIVMNEAYVRIMTMGPQVIRFILRDLAEKPAHWFWALHNLVPEGQDPAEGLTTIEDARQAWLRWGRDNHYL